MQHYLTALGLALSAWLPIAAPSAAPAPATPAVQWSGKGYAVCATAKAGAAACQAKVRAYSDGSVSPAVTAATVPGLTPQQLRSAYSVPTSVGGRIAVVGAYDNPNAQADLNKYSQNFGLPILPACTTSVTTSCLNKVAQNGTKNYPARNRSWAFETDLDLQAAHAMCPTCRIDLAEAKTNSLTNLLTAVDRAVQLGSPVVSMSWGGGEFSTQPLYGYHFTPANVSFVAASGDSGYGASWPAASANVMAVGGTSLSLNSDGTRASETAWDGGGSGCSAYEPKPARQHDAGCANRTIADVAAVADPNTGIAMYSSYSPYGTGWFQVGGTSLSTPVVAGLIAIAGAQPQATIFSKLYSAGSSDLYDVTVGSNGSCSPGYLCTAGSGYDGPTGVGAPIGPGAL